MDLKETCQLHFNLETNKNQGSQMHDIQASKMCDLKQLSGA